MGGGVSAEDLFSQFFGGGGMGGMFGGGGMQQQGPKRVCFPLPRPCYQLDKLDWYVSAAPLT
jgi:hypothetical protein